jgi:hypothetical protein
LEETPETHARAALEEFLAAWNAADLARLRTTLNYPHLTMGPAGQTFVARTPEEFVTDFAQLRAQEGWHHTTFDDYRMIASAPRKVHCEVSFSRFREDGTNYGGGRVLYVVTDHDGHWGMQFRSGIPDAGLVSAARRP